MSASPCRADLFASQSLEASGEKMQSSFSRSHTSLTKTRQTQNHIHIGNCILYWYCSCNTKSSPGVLSLLPGTFSSRSFLLNCRSCSFLKVKHISFGGFPNILVYFPEEFFERPFLMRIDQETDKSQGSTKLLQNTQKERQDQRVRPWAPVPQSHGLKS